MSHRPKILILENDDFLRELLGNILHKKSFYIINGMTIAEGLDNSLGQHIDILILGTSCSDYQGKSSLHYINQKLGNNPKVFVINNTGKKLNYVDIDLQMQTKNLSVESLVKTIIG